jgi:hypothetical protein
MCPVMVEPLVTFANLMRLKDFAYDMGESIGWKMSYLPKYKLHLFPKLMIFKSGYDISCS